MAFASVEDTKGDVEIVVFPENYEKYKEIINKEEPVIVVAQTQKKDEKVKLIADEIVPINMAEQTWTASIIIKIDSSQIDTDILDKLKQNIENYHGSCKTYLNITIPKTSTVVIELAKDYTLDPDPKLFKEIEQLLGSGSIETRCSQIKQKTTKRRW